MIIRLHQQTKLFQQAESLCLLAKEPIMNVPTVNTEVSQPKFFIAQTILYE